MLSGLWGGHYRDTAHKGKGEACPWEWSHWRPRLTAVRNIQSHEQEGRGRRRGCGRGTGLGLAESQAPVQEETDDMYREEAWPRWWLMSDRAPETAWDVQSGRVGDGENDRCAEPSGTRAWGWHVAWKPSSATGDWGAGSGRGRASSWGPLGDTRAGWGPTPPAALGRHTASPPPPWRLAGSTYLLQHPGTLGWVHSLNLRWACS